MKNEILEAIKTGISKSFNFEVDSDESDFKIKKSKVKSNSVDNWVYEQYQEKYSKLIGKKDFKACVDLYNSGELNQKPRTIGYKVDKEMLRNLVVRINACIYPVFDFNWVDVSEITNMSELFINLEYFNCNISEWDVSNVTDMSYMFFNCVKFNQDLSQWNVSNVTNMQRMFSFCVSFNFDISSWDVSNVTNMDRMFQNCIHFNKPLNSWDVSSVENMDGLFYGCTIFNQPLDKWDVSNVTCMGGMFNRCWAFDQDLSMWNTRNVSKCSNIFNLCPIQNANKPDLKNANYFC